VKAALAGGLCLLVLSIIHPDLAAARELWKSETGQTSFELSGSLRELLTVSETTSIDDFQDAVAADLLPPPGACATAATFPNCPAFLEVGDFTAVTSLTRLRTRFDGAFPKGFSLLLIYDHEVEAGDIETLEGRLRDGFDQKTLFGAEGVLEESEHVEWRHRLYRGSLRFEGGPVLLEVGRQRIAWGVGRLWNPIDRLNAIGPLAIEADQSAGIDSVDLVVDVGSSARLELVYAPARSIRDDRYAARFEATIWDTDLGLIGGLFQQNPTIGFDLARNVGDAAARVEVVWTDPERDVWRIGAASPSEPDAYWQVVLSIDNNFDIGEGLYVLVEHLYNGNALGFGRGRAGSLLPFFEQNAAGLPVVASSAVFGGSQVVSSAEQQTGLQVGYDLTPETRAEMLTILDWNGASAIFFPSLRYSPTGSIDITAGFQAGVGPRRSQYGEAGVLGFLLVDFFF
jgi:hypothetical protein